MRRVVAKRVGGWKALMLGLMISGTSSLTFSAVGNDEVVFGELELFDFDTFAQETRYGWSSGDTLVKSLDLNSRIGRISGSKNKRISKAVKAWGVTIIPEIRADTRSGARLTSSLNVNAGVELSAGVTVGGDGFVASVEAGPTLGLPGEVKAGEFFCLQGASRIGASSVFDPGLPKFDAGMDVILNGSFNNKFEYGLFPVAGYKVGDFGFDFDLDFNLFDFDFDLNLPELPNLNLPSFPDFEIPPSQNDDTLFRQKLPPSNPLLSIAELAINNPIQTVSTETELTRDGRLTTRTKGGLVRAGLDIDGIASAVASGGFSFTGTSVKVGPGKLGYDLIDVKYGVELGIEYNTEIDPFINATLNFDKAVLVENEDGTTSEITSYSGRWDELPKFGLLTREDVNVSVDFTDIEAMFGHTGALTLSDYMELRALEAFVSVAPGVKIVDLGPAYYQKFPLAGEFANVPLFDTKFSLGSIGIPEGLWDGSFVLEAAVADDVAFGVPGINLESSSFVVVEDGSAAGALDGQTLVIGQHGSGDTNRQDLTPMTFLDNGSLRDVNLGLSYDERVVVTSPRGTTVRYEPVEIGYAYQLPSDEVLELDGLVVPEGSGYILGEGGVRRFSLNIIENDGVIQGEGFLGIENASSTLVIRGEGEMVFNSPGAITADNLIHREGHTITFGAFTNDDLVTLDVKPSDYPAVPEGSLDIGYQIDGMGLGSSVPEPTPYATTHVFDVNTLDNAGTINFGGSDFIVTTTTFTNQASGEIRVEGGSHLTIDNRGSFFERITNSGLIEAVGAGTTLDLQFYSLRGARLVDPDTGDSISMGQGEIIARDGAMININSISIGIQEQKITAKDGSVITFGGPVQLLDDVELGTEVGGTINLDGGLEVKTLKTFDIVNAGTLNISSRVSLIPNVNVPRDEPPPVIVPIGLTNTGTVNVTEGGSFEFGVKIQNFANNGATLAGGTWNLLGAEGDHSNLNFAGTRIDIRVLGVENEDDVFFDVFGGKTAFDTDLKTNAADVTLHGQVQFRYFNTVETNEGALTISGGHQFTTAGAYTNDGGVTNVESGGDLFVQGILRVNGGEVNVGVDSTLTAQTQTEVIDEEGTTADTTVEVIGGTLNIASDAYLAGTAMFFDRTDLIEGRNFIGLNAGQVWVVREQVSIDASTEEEIVTPAAINLGTAVIERNNGTIIIDGEGASFDAAEGMHYNHGTLILQNGFEFNTLVNDYRNANEGEMILQAARFIVEGEDGTFRNDGTMVMDGESYLQVDHFLNGDDVNGPNATLLLDGVLDAGLVTNASGSTISGSGMITGSIVNHGTLDLGNSPGLIETFGSYTQGEGARAVFEVMGYEAGVSYDQLVVHQVEAVGGDEEPQPELVVTLDGQLELVFSDDLFFEGPFEWVLIDNQGSQAILGELGLGDLGLGDILVGGLNYDELFDASLGGDGDFYLGDLQGAALFLTFTGGDGNDLAIYTNQLFGDFDVDFELDAEDIDLLAETIRGLIDDAVFDLNHDLMVDEADLEVLIEQVLATAFGDATLDGVVNLEDLALLATHFGESGKGWGDGDFNADGLVNLEDLALLATDFGFDRNAVAMEALSALGATIPEPGMFGLLGVGGMLLVRRRRRV